VQTLGTALQLSGNAITVVSLLYALQRLTRFLNHWRDTARSWPIRLRESLSRLGRQTSTGTAKGSYGWSSRVIGVAPTTGTPEERITQLEGKLVEQRVRLTEMLRTAIDEAIANERDASKAVRLWEIYVAVFGLLVSISGYLCQLVG
jgi:hypothetical protein